MNCLSRCGAWRYIFFIVLSLLLLFFIQHFGVNVPFNDDWEILGFLDKLNRGSLTLADMLSQHNEHRVFFPRIILLLDAMFFSFNLKLLMYLVGIMLICTGWLCLVNFDALLVEKKDKWLCIIIPLILFSFRQFENLLWGFQISFLASLLFPCLAFHLLHRLELAGGSKKLFITSIIFAIIASFSSSQGLLAWPCGLLLLYFSRYGARKFHLQLWGIAGCIVWLGYFSNFQQVEQHRGMMLFKASFAEVVEFFCAIIGNAFLGFVSGAVYLGAAILALSAVTLYRSMASKNLHELRFWLAISLFSLLSLAAITFGRAGAGIDGALTERYISYSLLFVVSTVVMTLITESKVGGRTMSLLKASVLILLVVSLPFSYYQGWKSGIIHRSFQEGNRFLLKNYRFVPDSGLTQLCPGTDGAQVRQWADILQKINHEVFSSR